VFTEPYVLENRSEGTKSNTELIKGVNLNFILHLSATVVSLNKELCILIAEGEQRKRRSN
jgi:hypothetical protein